VRILARILGVFLAQGAGERVGIFLLFGKEWRHYRGENPGGRFEIFNPGHEPVLAWRLTAHDVVAAS
jgi:hypothetical protein